MVTRRADPALLSRPGRGRISRDKFERNDELFPFVSGMLSRHSASELIGRLREVAREFAALHREDIALPLAERHGTSLLLCYARLGAARIPQPATRLIGLPRPRGGVLHLPFVPSPPAACDGQAAAQLTICRFKSSSVRLDFG